MKFSLWSWRGLWVTGSLCPDSCCALVMGGECKQCKVMYTQVGGGFNLQLEALAQLFRTVNEIRIDLEPKRSNNYL